MTGEPRFVPTEIHLLTTAEGAQRAWLTLPSDEPGWFHWLRLDMVCRTSALPSIRFTCCAPPMAGCWMIFARWQDNEAIADAITAKVRGN